MADNNSEILLVKNINVDREYKNVLSYTENQMVSLCKDNNNLIASSNKYSFIRTSGDIQTFFDYNDCLQANYIAFKNPDYSNKWFFAWIDEVIYKGDNNTIIKFTIDIWSTWFNKLTVKPSLVIREHVNDDTIGLHTKDENIGIEDVVAESEESIDDLNSLYDPNDTVNKGAWIVVFSNWDPAGEYDPEAHTGYDGKGFAGVTMLNRNIFGNELYLFGLNEDGVYDLGNFLYIINSQGHIADVKDICILPKAFIPDTAGMRDNVTFPYPLSGFGEIITHYKKVKYDNSLIDSIRSLNKKISPLHAFTGFTPKNNKLFCYPFNYLMVTNNIGSNNIYKYEDFGLDNNNQITFKLELSVVIGGSGRLIPMNYKGITDNIDESLTLGKYPTCSWSADSYINWLTQNAVNIAQTVITGVGGLALGSPMAAVSSAASLFQGFYKAQLLPNITGGQTTGDISFTTNNTNFKLLKMRAKTEFLKQVDSYFTKYGYKINEIKTPNITGRTYYNYIEISPDSIIGIGNIPPKALEEINNICRKGVTIWHNNANVGNYNLNNTIV